jgi:hypothetical protein
VADAAGALVGVRHGKHRYFVLNGRKSVEGSSAFFLSAFTLSMGVLHYQGEFDRWTIFLISWILALLTMMIEALADRGFDNLTIPLAASFFLMMLVRLDHAELVWRGVVLTLLMLSLWAAYRFTTLTGGALLGAVLLGYGCFAFGGVLMLMPVFLLFLAHLWVTWKFDLLKRVSHGEYSLLGLAVPVCTWIVVLELNWCMENTCVAGVWLTVATHWALVHLATRVMCGNVGGLWKPLMRGAVMLTLAAIVMLFHDMHFHKVGIALYFLSLSLVVRVLDFLQQRSGKTLESVAVRGLCSSALSLWAMRVIV